MYILYFISGLVLPTLCMIYSGYRKDMFASLFYYKSDEKLNCIVKDLRIVFPGLSNYKIYPTSNPTYCVNKRVMYINTNDSDEQLIIEKILHEYAHIINIDFYGHDEKFYQILSNLYIDLNKSYKL